MNKRNFEKDNFAAHCGIEIIDVSQGHARVKMEIKDFHLNGLGITHGGAIFTLADFAFALASNSYGKTALAINATISFFRAVSSGALFAEAQEISRTRRLATYEIKVTDKTNELVALFQGTVFIKNPAKN